MSPMDTERVNYGRRVSRLTVRTRGARDISRREISRRVFAIRAVRPGNYTIGRSLGRTPRIGESVGCNIVARRGSRGVRRYAAISPLVHERASWRTSATTPSPPPEETSLGTLKTRLSPPLPSRTQITWLGLSRVYAIITFD